MSADRRVALIGPVMGGVIAGVTCWLVMTLGLVVGLAISWGGMALLVAWIAWVLRANGPDGVSVRLIERLLLDRPTSVE